MDEIRMTILRDDETIGGTCPSTKIGFPTSRYELTDALERARISNAHPSFTCTGYQCAMPGLAERLPEKVDLSVLNFLAHRLAGLSEWDRMAYEGMLQIDPHPKTMGNLINLTYNLAACQCADVTDDYQLGKLVVDNGLLPNMENIPDYVLEWLDYEKVGTAQRESEHGVFVHGGYVVNDADSWEQVYPEVCNPDQIPEQDMPIDGIFRVHAGREGVPGGFVLPVSVEQQQALLDLLRIEYFGNLVLLGATSSIPPLNAMLEKYESFDYLNGIATVLAEVPKSERLKLKAALEYESCTDLSWAADISQQLKNYEHLPELDTPEDYGKWTLLQKAGLSPDDPILNLLSFKQLGLSMMERDNARCTRYGIVRRLTALEDDR